MLNCRLDVMGEAQHFEKPQKHLERERERDQNIQDVSGTLGWLKGAQEMGKQQRMYPAFQDSNYGIWLLLPTKRERKKIPLSSPVQVVQNVVYLINLNLAVDVSDEVPNLMQKQTPKQFVKCTTTSPEEVLRRPCS
ncbi:hypothetical protein NPIL_384141 [Nephila pilipes]|uniref:Uncharacterized protein n=1 Tax=Nephila pilipes TaxID=299642 RepID=A0A8X6Q5T3_NEPPI|nr:hypothetical protein NPIL_384141 [Nephila pilipes]